MPVLLLAMPPVVAAAGPTAVSARAFLQTIYGHYRKGGTGVPLKRPERWFEARLAAAIRADIAESNRTGDIGKLDADLFCDCQDFEDIKATIGPVAIKDGKASVSVVFVNGGPVTVRYTLLWTRAGWRVFDIEWEEGGRLRDMFLPDIAAQAPESIGSSRSSVKSTVAARMSRNGKSH